MFIEKVFVEWLAPIGKAGTRNIVINRQQNRPLVTLQILFYLPDGGFHQVNIVFMVHPETNQLHAFIVASHEEREGPWQEFISCDELLDCHGWDAFLDGLYGYQLDSGLDLSVTNRDAFFQLTPEWVDLLV